MSTVPRAPRYRQPNVEPPKDFYWHVLNDCRNIHRELTALENEEKSLMEHATDTSVHYSLTPRRKNAKDTMSDAVIRLTECRADLQERRIAFYKLRSQADIAISMLKTQDQRIVARHHFICGYSKARTGRYSGCSGQTVDRRIDEIRIQLGGEKEEES